MSNVIRLQSPMQSGQLSSVQLLRTGEFTDMFGTDVSITTDLLRDLQRGFQDNLGMIENTTGLPVNYSHMSGQKAAGWIRDVRLQEEDGQLWIDVDWTPAAVESLQNGEFKFISAEFTAARDGGRPQLLGAGLTNIPAVMGMEPISLSQFTEQQQRSLADQLMEQFNLQPNKEQTMSEENKKDAVEPKMVPESQVALARDKAELVALQSQIAGVKEEMAKLTAERVQLQREAEFDALLSEEKAVPAQRDAYLQGDVVAFAAGAMALNTRAAGVNADGKEKASLSADEAASELAVKAEEIAKRDSIALHRAFTVAADEHPDLVRLSNKK